MALHDDEMNIRRQRREEMALRYHFFRPFRSDLPLKEHLRQMQETLETRIHRK